MPCLMLRASEPVDPKHRASNHSKGEQEGDWSGGVGLGHPCNIDTQTDLIPNSRREGHDLIWHESNERFAPEI